MKRRNKMRIVTLAVVCMAATFCISPLTAHQFMGGCGGGLHGGGGGFGGYHGGGGGYHGGVGVGNGYQGGGGYGGGGDTPGNFLGGIFNCFTPVYDDNGNIIAY